ncbi:putative quinone synthetase [Chiua virens]|nr:putative quinone synthetase [Chiua virens]
MAPVATPAQDTVTPNVVSILKASLHEQSPSTTSTLVDVLSYSTALYPSHELSFITSSSHDSSMRTKTFSAFNQSVRNLARALVELNKPAGSVILVYLTEHEDNMDAIWACLLAGYVPCLQPALSAQQAHKEAHISHITNVTQSAVWITNGNWCRLRIAAEGYTVSTDWCARTLQPDDEAILFLTSGSTGFSKVVVHTHRTIIAACFSKGGYHDLTSQSKFLNWVGFDHVAGSIENHITPLLYGASQLHVHASVILSEPPRFFQLIEANSITLTFAPNSLLATLARDLEKRRDLFGTFNLSTLTRINSGGEAVVAKNALEFLSVFKKLTNDPVKWSFVLSPGFGMTETCAGCIHNLPDFSISEPKFEFLEVGGPHPACNMRIVSPEDGVTLRPDGESGELQIRGPMVFPRYHNNPEATESSFVEGGWFRTGDIGIIEYGSLRLCGRIKDTIIVHGVSYGIPELEAHLQIADGVTHTFLAVAPYRTPDQQTEGFVVFYSPAFDLYGKDVSARLSATHSALRDISVNMITLPPQHIIPIPFDQMEKTTLGKLSRARLLDRFQQGEFTKHLARAEELLRAARGSAIVAPSTETERTLARIYAFIFNMDPADISATDDFFELGGNSIDVIRLKRESESAFNIDDISTIKILKHPVLSNLANFIEAIKSDSVAVEEYDPVIPLNLTGDKTPLFMVHPGVGEVLIFVNLAKYFRDERPFYAFRARGFEPGHPFFTSMDEMVSSYAAALKRTQPHGPYAIAGYSFGGVVAFEVAKRLEAMGDEVKFMGIIDIGPHIAHRMQDSDWTRAMLSLSYFLGLLHNFQDTHDLVPTLRPLSRKEQLDWLWNTSPPERLVELQLTRDKLDHWVEINRSLTDCGKDYYPTGSVGAVDLFYTLPLHGSREDWFREEFEPWKDFSRAAPTHTHVPEQHYTLMNLVNVPKFQRIFRSRIAARGI